MHPLGRTIQKVLAQRLGSLDATFFEQIGPPGRDLPGQPENLEVLAGAGIDVPMDDAEAGLEEVRSTVSSMRAALDGINRNLEVDPVVGPGRLLRVLSLPLLALKSPSMRGRAATRGGRWRAGAGHWQDEHTASKEV